MLARGKSPFFWNTALALFSAVVLTVARPALAADEPLRYLTSGLTDPALLAPPPIQNSAEFAADMAQVVAVHRVCTSNDMALAYSEKEFSAFNFTAAIGDFFQPGKFPKTEAFLKRVQEEAELATDNAKVFWKRPRPFTIDTNLANGKLETSFSYPSGHSTEGTAVALVLAEIFPDKSDAVLAISRDLGWHRVWIARHYPTDIHAGRTFARVIVRQMEASAEFQRDLAEAKEEIATARAAKVHVRESAALPLGPKK